MSCDIKPTAVDANIHDGTLDTKGVILQLTTCLGEETKRATTSQNIAAIEPLYNDVLLRMKGLRGNVEWTNTERQNIMSTLQDFKHVMNANLVGLPGVTSLPLGVEPQNYSTGALQGLTTSAPGRGDSLDSSGRT